MRVCALLGVLLLVTGERSQREGRRAGWRREKNLNVLLARGGGKET
jgi:hypothetical protein